MVRAAFYFYISWIALSLFLQFSFLIRTHWGMHYEPLLCLVIISNIYFTKSFQFSIVINKVVSDWTSNTVFGSVWPSFLTCPSSFAHPHWVWSDLFMENQLSNWEATHWYIAKKPQLCSALCLHRQPYTYNWLNYNSNRIIS